MDFNDNNECMEKIYENYKYLIDSEKLYICNTLKIQIFSANQTSLENSKKISKKNNIPFIDINKCLDLIIENNENLKSKDELIIIIIIEKDQINL